MQPGSLYIALFSTGWRVLPAICRDQSVRSSRQLQRLHLSMTREPATPLTNKPALALTNLCAVQSVLEQEAKVAGYKSEVVKAQELHLAVLVDPDCRPHTFILLSC